jgi:hypothetical protein
VQIILVVTVVLHILSGVFWAGSTLALARTGAASAGQLFRPQMGAAAMAGITGGVLWYLLHPSGFNTMERVLALGSLVAVLAAGVQGALCGRSLRQLARNGEKDTQSKARVALGHRVAASLLVLTVICMAAARYV